MRLKIRENVRTASLDPTFTGFYKKQTQKKGKVDQKALERIPKSNNV